MASPSTVLRCPECGADLPLRSPATTLIVCSYCRSSIAISSAGAALAGEKSRLVEGFTRLYTGASGTLRGTPFEVLGRVRYRHRTGLWDEWFVRFSPTRSVWITEDDHLLAIQSALPGGPEVGPIASLLPGQRFEFEGARYEVDEVGETTCAGVEGELPKTILPGEHYRYLDASSLDGRLALGIELDGAPPTVFRGQWLPHQDVRLSDEGREW